MRYGIRYSGAGDSWFIGVSVLGNTSFDQRPHAVLFDSAKEAENQRTLIPVCVRQYFVVSRYEEV